MSGAKSDALFDEVNPKNAGIDFENRLPYTENLNCYLFKNFYNGGGVAIADVNNDGLPDLFFCGNQVSNRLYLNKGDFQFEDVTDRAGLRSDGSWTTGASWADVNGDGLVDLYLCKSGPPDLPGRRNQLFIQQPDGRFFDKATDYGVDVLGLSTHAVFFDYDHDNDLDFYLLSNSIRSVGGYDLREGQREKRDPNGANKFFRNDGGSHFTDVSAEAGIYGSDIGFGLGVAVGDYNRDGWQDMFVSNDFFERDYLYLNQKNGTFKELGAEVIEEMSMGSMGADIADLNNDSFPDIFVTEMLPRDYQRYKTKTQFDNWNKFALMTASGYHHQYGRNVLHLNDGHGGFMEVGRAAGVEATDWSWGALIADFDLDGWKDIFVANGIGKDLLDQDYLAFYSDRAAVKQKLDASGKGIVGLIDEMPSAQMRNFLFRNKGQSVLDFDDISAQAGFSKPGFSNGSAYADLDNDGDLDLVTNNLDAPPGLYRNQNPQKNHALTMSFKGEGANPDGLGVQVMLYGRDKFQFQELAPMRGFQSCVDDRLVFGLGQDTIVPHLRILFPVKGGFKAITLDNVRAGQHLHLDVKNAVPYDYVVQAVVKADYALQKQDPISHHKHQQGYFGDFDREPLLFHMYSTAGPALAVADVNHDGLEDCYIGGGVGQAGALFLQGADGFRQVQQNGFLPHAASNDVAALFFDADSDGDPDLYVGSGCNGNPPGHHSLADRLYINTKGVFKQMEGALPPTKPFGTAWVLSTDLNTDGHADVLVGMRAINGRYGADAGVFALMNDGKGHFSPDRTRLEYDHTINRMTTAATLADVDVDGDSDLITVFDWGTPVIFINESGKLKESKQYNLQHLTGWWTAVAAADLNKDKFPDILLGNHGLNSRFKASAEKPIELHLNDIDGNGTIDPIIAMWLGDTLYPAAQRADLVRQVPALKKDILKSNDFAKLTFEELKKIYPVKPAQADVLKVNILESMVLLSNQGSGYKEHKLSELHRYGPVYDFCELPLQMRGSLSNSLWISAGNNLFAKPECGGQMSTPVCAITHSDGLSTRMAQLTDQKMKGNIRHMATLKGKNKTWLLATRTNQTPLLFLSKS